MTQPADQSMIVNLPQLADTLLASARESTSRRAAHTVFGGRDRIMRQTLVALTADAELGEHDSPGEATLFVLNGHVVLRTAGDGGAVALRAGDHIDIPAERHAVDAVVDSVFLLTAVPRENLES